MTYEQEVEDLQGRYKRHILRVEEECAAKIAAPLGPASYSPHAPLAAAWDEVRRANRQVAATERLTVQIETLDQVYADELDAIDARWGYA